MTPRLPTRNREQGVALVTTVIVVAVLAVVAVAMMQSTTVDRLSSRSVANYTRAELAAEAGAASAQALVTDLVRRYPDSVTVWQNIGGGAAAGTSNEATVLYLRAQSANTNLAARPGQFGGEVTLLARPLVSLATDQLFPLSGVVSAVPRTGAEVVNLNATNASRPRPLVGLRFATNAPVTAAQWVYLTNSAGETNARFAYWVEDESFKVNVNVVTNGTRADGLGLSAAELRLDGSWGAPSNSAALRGASAGDVVSARNALPGGRLPSALTATFPANLTDAAGADELRFLTTTDSAGLDLSRGGFKRFNINTVTNGVSGPTDANNIRTGLNRVIAAITNTNSAPNFGQRFYRLRNDVAGINAVNAVSPNHAAIYLNKIAANVLDYVDENDQPTVISNDASFSLVTGRPTNGILPVGGGVSGTNPIAAMGVENVPRLQEYAIHLRLRKMRWDATNNDSFGFVANTNQGASNPTTATYEVWLDHYFEFWNPGTRDYTNSPDTFLKIFDQPAWGPGSGPGTQPGPVTGPPRGGGSFVANNRATSDIPLLDALTGEPVVFPAGEVTVLTTAPANAMNADGNPADVLVPDLRNLIPLRVPAADRIFTGTTSSLRIINYDYQPAAAGFNGGPDFGYNRLFEVQMQFGRPTGAGNTDYGSGVLIGNNQGIIESHVGLPIGVVTNTGNKFSAIVESSWNRNDLDHIPGNIFNGNIDNVRGGGLAGNINNGVSTALTYPNSREGDPRSLLEQLEMNIYSSAGGFDQTRFYNSMGPGANPVFVNNTFGRPNANYVRPADWPDHSSINAGASNAPLFVRNGAMQSIGELGHLTDPARPYITAGAVPVLARGGGRTLRVGQGELTNRAGTNVAWYDGSQTSASRTWTAWRLADIFTTTAASNNATARDSSGSLTNGRGVVRGGTNTNGAVVTIPGLINPNGVLRDGGAAMRAALQGMRFLPSPDGSPNAAGRPVNVTNLVNALLTRMTNVTGTGLPAGGINAFWERGEISELPLFNSGTQLAVNMQQAFDRGREEVVRRSIEMITTRGSIYTVYAVGQTLERTNVLSTARMKQTFEIIPQFAPAALNDSFDATPDGINNRFAAPTNYTVRVLATSYD